MPSTRFFALAAVATAALFSTVNAHGKMTGPLSRGVSEKYHKDSGALINIGPNELMIGPIEGLSQHKQTDFPPSPTFNLLNGCRGTVYEEGNDVTTLAPGADFAVNWTIQAPHPGYMKLSILKPSTDSVGIITYMSYKTILNIEPFANNGGDDGTTAKMPADVTGCDKPGDCVLQFYWHSDIANQTYPTCSDIIVSGNGASTPSIPTAAINSDESDAGDDAPTAPVSNPEVKTDAPKVTTAPMAPTPAPESTTASPVPVPATKDQTDEVAGEAVSKCSRRMRRN